MPCIFNIFTDGGSRGNPGPAAIGIVIKSSSGSTIHSFGKTIGTTTNNIAEYQAVIAALEWLTANKQKGEFHFFSDSQLIVNQINGLWKIKDANLRQKIIFLRGLEAQLQGVIKYTYIPREKKSASDRLVNLSLDQQI